MVQRPESVVKELVENSLDSGADAIAVIVKGAGKHLIHVVDNGTGMSAGDLALSVKRHATSKIRFQEDLERIMSYGFRGEALASISSVAHLEIRSRRRQDSPGNRLIAEPNKEPSISPYAAEFGTQVFVKNLFYNVPARRKFLRTELTEFRHISDTMLKFSLARPEIRFTFYDGDNLVFDLHPSDTLTRIKELIGDGIVNSLINVEFEAEYISIKGFIAEPAFGRSSAGQYLYLNRRPILSRALNHAVYSVYEPMLDRNQKPFFVLYLETDSSRVDVNIHPQKQEVKFEDERLIYNLTQRAVSEALRGKNLIPDLNVNPYEAQTPFEIRKDSLINRATGEVFENSDFRREEGKFRISGSSPAFRQENYADVPGSAYDMLFGRSHTANGPAGEAFFSEEAEFTNTMQTAAGLLFLENETGLYCLDLKGAYMKIAYREALAALEGGGMKSQDLLFPEALSLSKPEIAALQSILQDIKILGFDIEINDNRAIIKGLPLFSSGKAEQIIKEILAQAVYSGINPENRKSKIALSFAKKTAKIPAELSDEEIKKLLKDISESGNPHLSPDGRKILTRLSPEKLFF